jgi:tungstate transport system substrate-binding protein
MKFSTRNLLFALSLILAISLTACLSPSGGGADAPPPAPVAPANPNLILATTTSTQDSGLLDVLVPMFQTGNRLHRPDDCCRHWRGPENGRRRQC